MAKSNEKSMELEIKNLQKHMGGLVKTILDLKAKVEALGKKGEGNQMDEIEKIHEKQRINDKAIAANTNAITKIDKELRALEGKKEEDMIKNDDVIESDHRDHSAKEKSDDTRCTKRNKCRYFNRGYCKFTKCRFIHPEKLCSIYLEGGNCDQSCPDRHPKVCKWIESVGGCRRENCAYLHNDKRSDRDASRQYKCEGCKTLWDSKNHVVEHDIQNKIMCLLRVGVCLIMTDI